MTTAICPECKAVLTGATGEHVFGCSQSDYGKAFPLCKHGLRFGCSRCRKEAELGQDSA